MSPLPCPGLNIPEWFVCPETCPDIVYQVSVYKRQGGPGARGNIGQCQLQCVPCPRPPSPRLWPRVSDGVYSRGPGGIGTLLTEHAVMMIPGNIKIKWIFVSVLSLFIWESINNSGLDISHFRQKTNKLENWVSRFLRRFKFSFISWKTILNSKSLHSNKKVKETLMLFCPGKDYFHFCSISLKKWLMSEILIRDNVSYRKESFEAYLLKYASISVASLWCKQGQNFHQNN